MTPEMIPAAPPEARAPVVAAQLPLADDEAILTPGRLRGLRFVARGVMRDTSGKVGVALLVSVLVLALVGPLLAPHDPSDVVGPALAPPGEGTLLGTDTLGRDVLSRFLSGGRVLLAVAFGATIAAYVIGGILGLLAGYRRGVVDAVSLGVVDVFIAIPPIILSLVLVAAIGGGVAGIALAVMVVQIPPVMRLVRSFTAAVAGLEYVEAARSRGETLWSILFREILPNIRVPLLADVGIRTSWSIILFASLSFLGLGQAPPAADWGLMISENREAILITPLVVVVPALALACLSVSINLTADSLARSIGRSSGGRNA